MPSVLNIGHLNKILISIKEGIIKKFLWASRLWVGRRLEPILGYVPKNDETNNLVHKGLKVAFKLMIWAENVWIMQTFSSFFYYFPCSTLEGVYCPWLRLHEILKKINFYCYHFPVDKILQRLHGNPARIFRVGAIVSFLTSTYKIG